MGAKSSQFSFFFVKKLTKINDTFTQKSAAPKRAHSPNKHCPQISATHNSRKSKINIYI